VVGAFLSKPRGAVRFAQKVRDPRLVNFAIDDIVAYFQQLKIMNARR